MKSPKASAKLINIDSHFITVKIDVELIIYAFNPTLTLSEIRRYDVFQ